MAIVTSHLAHYRRHLYKILDEAPDIQVTHFSGAPSKDGILSLKSHEVQRLVPIADTEMFRAHWQRGVLRMAFEGKHDAYIFTGDVKYISTWIAGCILRIKKKRVYFWTIGWHRPENGMRNYIRLSFYKIANRLLLYGDREKHLAIRQGYPAEKTAVIYNSISEVEKIDVKEVSSNKEGHSVGAIARLGSAKNFHLLLKAAAILKSQGDDIKVVLGGDGPERQSLEEKATQLGVSSVFVGAVHDDAEIKRFYQSVSVTVVPSAAGLTTIQSLSHGVPVITDDNDPTQGPETNAILPGVTGSRYEAGSAHELAKEIKTWLSKVTDDPYTTAKHCANEVRSRWSPSVQATRMLQAIGAPHTKQD